MSGVVKKPQSLEKSLISVISEDGKEVKKLALSKDWCEERSWMQFSPLENSDDWFESVSEYEEDLQWLLFLPHNKFWSQLVFDPGSRGALVSYLQRSPRSYDCELGSLAPMQKEILTRVHNLVFKIYNRIATSKESDVNFLSKDAHGAMLYDNFLFDIPAMLDLCLLYGSSERRNLAKLLQNIIKSQPKYANDLQSTSQMFVKALKDLDQYFGVESGVNVEPVKLSTISPASSGHIKDHELQDYVFFLVDIVTSVSSLLEILPTMLNSFTNCLPEIEMSQFYEHSLPSMYRRVSQVQDEELGYNLNLKLNIARVNLLNVAKTSLIHRVNSLISQHDFNKAMGHTEEYLTVLSECLNYPRFVVDLHSRCPLDCDLKRLHQARPEILDDAKCNYLCDSVISCMESCTTIEPPRESPSPSEPSGSQSCSSKEPTPGPSTSSYLTNDAVAAVDVVLESLISNIQEMLPDLGSGFLKKCLAHYNMDKEAVINAVLEDSLPAGLKELDRTMPLLPPELENSDAILPQRLNVFDHDEFDIMSRNHIDTSRIHQGKRKSKHKNISQLLDDKSDLAQIKSSYNSYSTVTDIVYDDEYDDTYDEVKEIRVGDGNDPDTERRPFVTPRVLAKKEDRVYVEEEEVSGDEAEEVQPNRDNFAQDPALLRERAQQRRDAKYGPPRPQGAPRGDVVGKPKGQGQDSQTQQNRKRKDANKSSRGNHNRRAGAERKLRQGMIPS